MLVVEKTRHIEATISGNGANIIFELIKEQYPQAQIMEDDEKALPRDSHGARKRNPFKQVRVRSKRPRHSQHISR